MAKEPKCCLYCGRDTHARCSVCGWCMNGEAYGSRLDNHPGYHRMDIPEDDYSEESGPDSVYPDSPESHHPEYLR